MNHDKVLLSASWWWWWLHEKTFRSAKLRIDNTKKRRTATSLKTNLIERERETGTSLSFLGLTGRQKCQERGTQLTAKRFFLDSKDSFMFSLFVRDRKVSASFLFIEEESKWTGRGHECTPLSSSLLLFCLFLWIHSVCFVYFARIVSLKEWLTLCLCVLFSSVSIDSKSDRKRREDVKIHTIVFSCKEKRIDWRQERHVLSNLLFSLTVKRREFFLSNPSLILSVTREASFRLTTKLLLIY